MPLSRKLSIVGSYSLLFCVIAAIPVFAQDSAGHKRFTNKDVIELVKMGLSEDVVIAKIRSAGAGDTSLVSLVARSISSENVTSSEATGAVRGSGLTGSTRTTDAGTESSRT